MCTCNVTTRADAELVLQLLDDDLHSLGEGSRAGDWLEYTTVGGNWGSGQALMASAMRQAVRTGSAQIAVNFRSDTTLEGRGFWLKYSGEVS